MSEQNKINKKKTRSEKESIEHPKTNLKLEFNEKLKLAEEGDVDAQCFIAFSYNVGENGVEQNCEKAFEWALKAANQGNAKCEYLVGWYYLQSWEKDKPVKRDENMAFQWLSKSSLHGNNDARFCLRHYFYDGLFNKYIDFDLCISFDQIKIVSTFPVDQLKYLENGVDEGECVAQFTFATFFESVARKYYREAAVLYLEAAEQGINEAQLKIADFYRKGIGGAQSFDEAFKWYYKAAIQNNERACYEVACCYDEGRGITQSYNDAFKWYSKTVEIIEKKMKMCPPSSDEYYKFVRELEDPLMAIGLYYLKGKGVAQSYEKAKEIFQSLVKNQKSSQARAELGMMHYYGLGVTKSEKRAFKWFDKVLFPNIYLPADILYFCATCYEKGIGCEADPKKAERYYKYATKKGYKTSA